MSLTDNLFFCMIFYGTYFFIIEFGIAMSSLQIARKVIENHYGSYFSFMTVIAGFLQLLIQLLIGKSVLGLSIQGRYAAFGVYHLFVTVLIIILAFHHTIEKKCRKNDNNNNNN